MSESISSELLTRFNKLVDIGVALSASQDLPNLLERILNEAMALTSADGGTLYTLTDHDSLQFEIMKNRSLALEWSRHNQSASPLGEVQLVDSNGEPNQRNVAAWCAIKQKTISIADAYTEQGFDFSGTRAFDQETGYRSCSFLTVPMRDHEGELIGVLQLINRIDRATGQAVAFSFSDQQLLESLGSQAAAAMTTHRLISSLRKMLEDFITVMADAIDEKSPHTGGHCRRVPVIADLLARAVNTHQTGPLAAVSFSGEDLYELKIAALLHDCGKVVTPNHVMEKSARLQTLFDRIYLVLMRGEALHLELKLAHAKGEISDHELKSKQYSLEQDLEFLKECNHGTTRVTQEMVDRLKQIATRGFINSYGEKEFLLNPSELDNLCIEHGTLNKDERQVIEDHALATIRMLEKLTYPSYLREVPEIAACHHERLDGSGYPRGLEGSQMSVRAKILAIADVFEALTAPDRPYKKPMTLSTALAILESEKERGHLDADLIDLFIEEKVYHQYAKTHVTAEQIDL